MRIAVIGSGIAGLVSSRRLSDLGHQVTMFERQAAIGMDAHSLEIANQSGNFTIARADVPSRMFNANQWPSLFELYKQVGVESVEVRPSQSFSEFGGATYLTLSRANRPKLLAGRLLDGKARRIVREALRLQKQGVRDIDNGMSPSKTTLEYLYDGNYTDEFIYEFLYPTLSSTVCTCSYTSLNHYPASTILSLLHNLTRDSTLLRTRYGTRDAVQRLLVDAVKLRLNIELRSAIQSDNEVQLTLADDSRESFDHLVIATQANTALSLVPHLGPSECAVLSAFQYESIPVVVHTDRNFMPARERDWSTFNMLVSTERRAAMCTIWLNQFHSDWTVSKPVFQTINAFAEPNPAQTIGRCLLQRPVVNHDSIASWESIARMNQQADRRIWFCGSYAGRGTPLLESGVVSANSVVESIQKTIARAY